MGKYIDKFITEFDKELDLVINKQKTRNESFIEFRNSKIATVANTKIATLDKKNPGLFKGYGGWSGNTFKTLKELYEYVFQKDGVMKLPPKTVAGKENVDYINFNKYIATRDEYNQIKIKRDSFFLQYEDFPGDTTEIADNLELSDTDRIIEIAYRNIEIQYNKFLDSFSEYITINTDGKSLAFSADTTDNEAAYPSTFLVPGSSIFDPKVGQFIDGYNKFLDAISGDINKLKSIPVETDHTPISFKLQTGMIGVGNLQDQAEGQTFKVNKITNLKCNITEIEFTNKSNNKVYGYYEPTPNDNNIISFKRLDQGVKSVDPCKEYSTKFNNFGTLTFSDSTEEPIVTEYNRMRKLVDSFDILNSYRYLKFDIFDLRSILNELELVKSYGPIDYDSNDYSKLENYIDGFEFYKQNLDGSTIDDSNYIKDIREYLTLVGDNDLSNSELFEYNILYGIKGSKTLSTISLQKAYKLEKGLKGVGELGDEAAGKTYIINKITDLNCGITEIEFKRITKKVSRLEYGYYQPTGKEINKINFRRLGDGVKSKTPCIDFQTFGNFGTLTFPEKVETTTQTVTTTTDNAMVTSRSQKSGVHTYYEMKLTTIMESVGSYLDMLAAHTKPISKDEEVIIQRTKRVERYRKKADFPFKPGDINDKIKEMQTWLGLTGKSADGQFGNGTYNLLLNGKYITGLDSEVTLEVYNKLKSDYESGSVNKKKPDSIVDKKPDPYLEFIKKAEIIKENGGGRWWFNNFMDNVMKKYVRNTNINDFLKKIKEYTDSVFGLSKNDVEPWPQIEELGNRVVDIYYTNNNGSLVDDYDSYIKFYAIILSDSYANKENGLLGVMSRDFMPNLIKTQPYPYVYILGSDKEIDYALEDIKSVSPEDEKLLLYNAFLEAGDYYETNESIIETIPLRDNKWEVIPRAARQLLDPMWETSGTYTFKFINDPEIIKVISGPSGSSPLINIPSYEGITYSWVDVGELFRDYNDEIVNIDQLDNNILTGYENISVDQYGNLDSESLDEEDDSVDNYDKLDEEYLEAEIHDDHEISYEASIVIEESMKVLVEEMAKIPPVDPNIENGFKVENPFNTVKVEKIPPASSGKGYPVSGSTTKFVNKHTNGIYPAMQHDDGTFIVVKAESRKGKETELTKRHWLKPNPQYFKLMKSVTVPLKGGKSVKVDVHPEFAEKLISVFKLVKAQGLNEFLFSSQGAFAVRNVTRGSRLTNHAYGFAIDVNADHKGWGLDTKWNVNNKTIKVGSQVYNWGPNEEGFYKIVKIMEQHGIGWLGTYDPMHFSIYESG